MDIKRELSVFIASCTDLLQIILKHFNGTRWVYDKYFDAINISRGDFSFIDKSNKRLIGSFKNRVKKILYIYVYIRYYSTEIT